MAFWLFLRGLKVSLGTAGVMEAVVVLTLILLKWRALLISSCSRNSSHGPVIAPLWSWGWKTMFGVVFGKGERRGLHRHSLAALA